MSNLSDYRFRLRRLPIASHYKSDSRDVTGSGLTSSPYIDCLTHLTICLQTTHEGGDTK